MSNVPPIADPNVAAAFAQFDDHACEGLMALRALIYEQAAHDERVGPLTESLRWGQPSYLTQATKAGTTIRLGVPKTGGFGLFTHCQTTVMSDFAAISGTADRFDGNRGVLFETVRDIDPSRHALLIKMALIYHLLA